MAYEFFTILSRYVRCQLSYAFINLITLYFVPARGFLYQYSLLEVAFCASVCKGITFNSQYSAALLFPYYHLRYRRTMKTLSVALLCLLSLSAARADTCYADVAEECNRDGEGIAVTGCNALYANYDTHGVVEKELKSYANLHLKRSYEYLLSASYFNNYKMNRVGFAKLFRKLSDDAWEKTIDLIKQITKRGDRMIFGFTESRHPSRDNTNYTAELRELESLAKALDTQKELAERAFYIHKESTKNSQHWHDPQVSQYLEEEFIEYQADRIRQLAGYTNDIKQFVNLRSGQDLSLSLYLYDEYLQKVA